MIPLKRSCVGTSGVPCPLCQGLFSLDTEPLLFRCPNRHVFTLELLHQDIPKGDGAGNKLRWSMVKMWEHQARMLRELSASALRNGHALIAADYRETATRIEAWMSSLSSLIARRAAAADPSD